MRRDLLDDTSVVIFERYRFLSEARAVTRDIPLLRAKGTWSFLRVEDDKKKKENAKYF